MPGSANIARQPSPRATELISLAPIVHQLAVTAAVSSFAIRSAKICRSVPLSNPVTSRAMAIWGYLGDLASMPRCESRPPTAPGRGRFCAFARACRSLLNGFANSRTGTGHCLQTSLHLGRLTRRAGTASALRPPPLLRCAARTAAHGKFPQRPGTAGVGRTLTVTDVSSVAVNQANPAPSSPAFASRGDGRRSVDRAGDAEPWGWLRLPGSREGHPMRDPCRDVPHEPNVWRREFLRTRQRRSITMPRSWGRRSSWCRGPRMRHTGCGTIDAAIEPTVIVAGTHAVELLDDAIAGRVRRQVNRIENSPPVVPIRCAGTRFDVVGVAHLETEKIGLVQPKGRGSQGSCSGLPLRREWPFADGRT
jgi:hypothetical protein